MPQKQHAEAETPNMSIYRFVRTPSELMRIGDRVIAETEDKPVSWTKRQVPDGTKGTVIGKYRYTEYRPRFNGQLQGREPGVYEKDGVAIVHWDGYAPDPTVKDGVSRIFGNSDASDVPGFHGTTEELRTAILRSRISESEMALVDQEEAERRHFEEWEKPVAVDKTISARDQRAKLTGLTRIADLPETMAWEGDKIILKQGHVQENSEGRPVHMRVHFIHYNWVPQEPHTYMVSWYFNDTGEYACMGSTYANDDDIERVERGNVWKHYNSEPTNFASLDEEVGFAHGMGLSEELRNPANALFRWNSEEALIAIRQNLAHGFTKGTHFDRSERIGVYRFTDDDLAQRIRSQVLSDYGIAV